MGTNYYALQPACPNPCAHCDQHEIHIGKSLCMIQAHDVSPWGRIRSWRDWRRILSCPGMRVRDEYGNEHDPADFIKSTEQVPMAARRRQYDWLVANLPSAVTGEDPTDWLDEDGFSVCREEFS